MIHITEVDIKHKSVKIRRKVYVRFKVSGYRNGKKDFNFPLITHLLSTRNWLVGQKPLLLLLIMKKTTTTTMMKKIIQSMKKKRLVVMMI